MVRHNILFFLNILFENKQIVYSLENIVTKCRSTQNYTCLFFDVIVLQKRNEIENKTNRTTFSSICFVVANLSLITLVKLILIWATIEPFNSSSSKKQTFLNAQFSQNLSTKFAYFQLVACFSLKSTTSCCKQNLIIR